MLVVETLITEDARGRLAKLADLEMLVMTQGRERTLAEYASLFAQAGLRLKRAIPTAAALSIVEGVAA